MNCCYVIGDMEREKYLRIHYFSGRVHYRLDAESFCDARLFRNRIEAIACYTALVDMKYPADFRVFAIHFTIDPLS
ncbi:MAG TPA: hypothetical protein VGK73_17490 [Polyangiaceae bacterium]